MKKYELIHEEYNTLPLTIGMNLHAWAGSPIRRILHGHSLANPALCEYWDVSLRLSSNMDAAKKATAYVLNKVKHDSAFAQKTLCESRVLGKQLIRIVQHYGCGDLASLSRAQLIRLLRDIYTRGVLLCTWGYPATLSDFFEGGLSSRVQEMLEKRKAYIQTKNSTVAEVFSLLTTPTFLYPSDIAKQELTKGKRSLAAWRCRWFWLTFGHLGPGLSKNDAKKWKRDVHHGGFIMEKDALRKKQQAWERQLHLTKQEKSSIETARIFLYLKGYRMEISGGVYSLQHRIADQVAARTGLHAALLRYAHSGELIDLLRGKNVVTNAELRRRKNYCVWIAHDVWDAEIFSGAKARAFAKKYIKAPDAIGSRNEVSGQVAYAGVVRGKVLIINTVADMKKVKGPFVMVSAQTTPELVPAMKRATAFVADVGGITCHTAIVAREMKKPCVIGTKIATGVFRDGDRVEVDATEGVVRKLS